MLNKLRDFFDFITLGGDTEEQLFHTDMNYSADTVESNDGETSQLAFYSFVRKLGLDESPDDDTVR